MTVQIVLSESVVPPSKKKSPAPYRLESLADRSKAAAKRSAKATERFEQAVRGFETLVASGQFFAPIKRRTKKAPQAPAFKLTAQPICAATTSLSVPANSFHRYENFKEKIRAEGTSVSGAIKFRYTNAAGESTSRTVLLSKAYPISCPEYVLGHCMLRNEDRTFSIDGIVEPRSSPGGEPIYDLRGWLRNATDA